MPERAIIEVNGTEYTISDVAAVKFDRAQTLTAEQKAQARANIGADEGGGGGGAGAVRYDQAQTLTAAQKQQARENIGANDIDAYTKAETDALLSDKADTATTLAGYGITDAYTKAEGEALRDYVLDMSPVTEASGTVVTIDDAAPLTAERVVVNIEPVQSGSGDPSPDNVRQISGWTGANIARTGKNLYSRELSEYNTPVYDQSGNTGSYPDVAVWWVKVKPNTRYTVSWLPASKDFFFRWINCDINRGFISRPGVYNSNTNTPLSFTTPSNTEWVQFAVNQYNTANIDQNNWAIQIEEGSIATPYEPYVSQAYAISWQTVAGMVYGGTLDVENGTLAVDRAEIASYNGETLTGEWISDRDVYTAGATPTIGAQVVYKLSAPVTYQLTPHEILLFRGANTIYADAGNTTMTYRQDVSILLDKLTAQVAALNAAVANS